MEEKKAFFWFAANVAIVAIAGGLITASGVLKLLSSVGTARILQQLDPVTGLTYQSLFLIAGFGEALAGLYILLSRNSWHKACLLCWITLAFLTYRVMLLLAGGGAPCPCLGRATDWWPWLAAHQEPVTITLLMFIGLSSVTAMTVQLAAAFRSERIPHIPTSLGEVPDNG